MTLTTPTFTRPLITWMAIAALATPLRASDSLRIDSSKTNITTKAVNFRMTARLHSLGLFGYAGLIANSNPAFDIALHCEGKKYGAIVLKAVDLYDLRSPYDFSLVLAYRKWAAGKHVSFTAFGGGVLEQTHKFAGHGSDAMALLVTNVKVSKTISIEHTARFSNCLVQPENFDWLNRLRVVYTHEHLDVNISGWHNNLVFDASGYASVGFNAAYSRVRVHDRVLLSTGISALRMAATRNVEGAAFRNGLLLTIAATVD